MSGVLAGTLMAVAVLLLVPHGRVAPAPRRAAPSAPRPGPSGRPGLRARLATWRRPRRRPPAEVGLLVAEVAARLRAGTDVAGAWAAAWQRAGGAGQGTTLGPDGVPECLRTLGSRRGGARVAVSGAVAACRLTHELGAPLAPVLEQCARGIVEAEQAERARAVALAGPRSTARLLAVLPFLGLALGGGLGAGTLTVLLDGAVGTLCLLGAVALLAVGHLWTTRLVRHAQQDGAP